MDEKIVIEGNAIYEIDEECMKRKEKEEEKKWEEEKKQKK